MRELPVRRPIEVTCGALSSCLVGRARDELEVAGELDGMDDWRRAAQHISQGAQVRKGLVRKAAEHPPDIAKLEGVTADITRPDGIMYAYTDVGGAPPCRSRGQD